MRAIRIRQWLCMHVPGFLILCHILSYHWDRHLLKLFPVSSRFRMVHYSREMIRSQGGTLWHKELIDLLCPIFSQFVHQCTIKYGYVIHGKNKACDTVVSDVCMTLAVFEWRFELLAFNEVENGTGRSIAINSNRLLAIKIVASVGVYRIDCFGRFFSNLLESYTYCWPGTARSILVSYCRTKSLPQMGCKTFIRQVT